MKDYLHMTRGERRVKEVTLTANGAPRLGPKPSANESNRPRTREVEGAT